MSSHLRRLLSAARHRLRPVDLPDLAALAPEDFARLKYTLGWHSPLSHDVAAPRDPGQLPRRVFIYWDKGLAAAPELVRTCVQSWRVLNPGWRIDVLEADRADRIVPRDKLPPTIREAHYSDILRARLLRDHGGVWADATVLALRPLDDWLTWLMAQSRFFAFTAPAPDRLLASWLLAAMPGDPLIAGVDRLAKRVWSRPPDDRPLPYFWFHYLFEYQIRTRPDLAGDWACMPRLSARPMLALNQTLKSRHPERIAPFIAHTPVQKLNFKTPPPEGALRAALHRTHPDLAAALFRD